MNILEKFENLSIENDKRVSKEDLDFCEREQKLYLALKAELVKILDFEKTLTKIQEDFEKANNTRRHYIGSFSFDNIQKDYIGLNSSFTEKIVQYFNNKYSISIKAYDINYNKEEELSYSNIINQIFDQLGGKSFKKVAINEIKNNFKASFRASSLKIYDKKIKLEVYVSFEKHWKTNNYYHIRYSYQDYVKNILKAIGMFEQEGVNDLYGAFYRYFKMLDSYNETTFDKINIDYDKIKSLKFFKNGKLEIEFTNKEFLKEFIEFFEIQTP